MTHKNFEYKIQILEHHLDSFGHVNNAKYLELYEQARWDFITKNGYGIDKIIQEKKGPVILDVNCRFKSEILNRETITIKSETVEQKGKIGRVKQVILKENENIASDAVFTIGFMDLEKRKLVNPPDDWLIAIGVK
ncbi:MAG: acyl-CoA thioesterase [Bacteriovoracaceae bacterium]|jgi:acyl-CoA thioester hydrolase|nr:thioesterase [Halobacteriovoraceae bacterium]MDP7321674.1 acyl-CoA thioesterase [Bacteriovoracaceae bacterium]|tara:strand:- start:568 stop:975 length:408 start_codon:yes stop_codon:yes gene_type:complete